MNEEKIMRYGIVYMGRRKCYCGLAYNDGNGGIKINLFNKRSGVKIKSKNKILFLELVKTINKFYDIEDLNQKMKTGSGRKYNIKINKMEFVGGVK